MAGPEFVARAVVPARAALAGNPSDGYGGAVLALTFGDFCARVEARTDPKGTIRPENELVARSRAAVRARARSSGGPSGDPVADLDPALGRARRLQRDRDRDACRRCARCAGRH